MFLYAYISLTLHYAKTFTELLHFNRCVFQSIAVPEELVVILVVFSVIGVELAEVLSMKKRIAYSQFYWDPPSIENGT